MHSLAHVTRRDRGRVGLPWLLGTLVLVGALVAAVAFGWTTGRLNPLVCGGACGPEAVATPAGLTLDTVPERTAPDPVVTRRPDPDAVRAAVGGLLDDPDLGGRVGASITALDGTSVLDREASATFVPASTTKLLTAYAALSRLDPTARFSTSTVLDGERVVLVGGGDPYLASTRPGRPTRVDRADLRTLAGRTAEALRSAGRTSVRIGYDAGLFTGPAVNPTWESSYVADQVVTPVSALWADQGERAGVRSATPAQDATARFVGYLRDAGIRVRGDATRADPGSSAQPLAVVRSATVAQVVDAMLVRSDNEAAEVLLRHVGIAAGGAGSVADGTRAVVATLRENDVPVPGLRLRDGSGLSRANRIAPATLAGVLRAASARAATAPLLADLPVGGFTGTLANRFGTDSAGRGLVRAKTGTLTGVHSLAGYVTDRDGTPLVFAVMTDDTEDVNPFVTQAAIDDVAAALAGCSCGG